MKYLFLILLFPQLSFAKCYVTDALDQQGNPLIECPTGFIPPNVIHDAPLMADGKELRYGGFLTEKTFLGIGMGQYEFDEAKMASAIKNLEDRERDILKPARLLRAARRKMLRDDCNLKALESLARARCEIILGR